MNPDLRKILDGLDVVLSGPDRALALQLWDVLSALRGPDSDQEANAVKAQTTAIIRTAAFPKAARMIELPVVFAEAVVGIDYMHAHAGGVHFEDHVRYAADALEIPEIINEELADD